jgi:anti-sigma regulatory factor (Ser/Thr protein kinase)/anti-anti-sigma regulatory factor
MTTRTLLLPYDPDAQTLFSEAQLLFFDGLGSTSELIIDFSRLNKISPTGVTFLCNLAKWFEDRGRAVRLANHNDRDRPAIEYMDDCGFFLDVEGLPIRPRAKPRPSTLPIERIKAETGHSWLESKLMPWLAPTLGMGRESLYPLGVCIGELLRNILDHSGRDAGSVFVQHFPGRNEVVISVADFGKRIPATVRAVAPNLDDAEAILRALQHGFSSKATPPKRGAGLDYLIETIIRTNGGRIDVFSGGGHVAAYHDKGTVQLMPVPGFGFCPGATFDITLRTDTIERVEDQPEALE